MTPFGIIRRQLDVYGEVAALADDPGSATEAVAFGLHLLDAIRRLRKQTRRDTLDPLIPAAAAGARLGHLGGAYRAWLLASERVWAQVQAHPAGVLNAARFRAGFEEARSVVSAAEAVALD